MFKIGDFSRLSRVSVKALRYYDELGLLKPMMIDRWTGYRYYSAEQLPRLNRILAFKELGLSLEQIAQLIDENPSVEYLRGMLRLKQAELQQRLQAEQARLALVEARLNYLEQEGTMPEYEVVLKEVPAQLVAVVRETIPNWGQVNVTFNRIFDEVSGYVQEHGGHINGLPFDRWLDPEMADTNMHVEAAVPIQAPIPESERVKVIEMEGAANMASVIHHGSFDGLSNAYNAILRWIEANGYRVRGHNREVYVQYERTGAPANYVTEIQFPVEKV
ncbi:MAG: MerR family transcriptional regulator [Herpetosiphonaceae bacterium]|nr:MerR family transcriptional regulator [Herpetosiphonaceae bacterium]